MQIRLLSMTRREYSHYLFSSIMAFLVESKNRGLLDLGA